MAILATSLVTLADAKVYLLKTDSTHDSIIEMIIDGVSAEFDRECSRALAKATDATLYLDGRGKQSIFLPRYPVISIASVKDGDDTLVVGDEDDDVVLYAKSGILKRVGGIWGNGSQNILLTSYVAGYIVQGAAVVAPDIALPADLKLACLKQVALEFQTMHKSTWGETTRTMKDGSVTRRESKGAFLADVLDVLDRYRDIRV